MRSIIIYHGRFPGEKAASLFAAKEADSLLPHGPVVILVPRRLQRDRAAAHTYYDISEEVRVVYLPILDLFLVPILRRVAFLVSYITFSFSCLVYLWLRTQRGAVVITNEALPGLAATLWVRKVVFEVHDYPERWSFVYSLLFRRAHTILCTNQWKKEELQKRFTLPEAAMIVERNGVDTERFGGRKKSEARALLGLPLEGRLIVYTGHLYAHKGVDALAEAALRVPDTEVLFVGGTPADVERFAAQYAHVPNIRVLGQQPHADMPLWQAAADVLVLPNSGRERLSAQYTSPMKLFEYMASDRPIVASGVPSIEEVLPREAAYLVPPDSPSALGEAIQRALKSPGEAAEKARRALALAQTLTWKARAERLMRRLS